MNNVPNLRFKEFSGQWNFIKIGDAFKDLSAGSTPSKNIPNYFRGDIPWLTSGELKQKYIYETREYITEEAVKSANLKIYDPGTLFIAITGLEAPGTRGSCAINKVKLTTNQSCMAFKKNNIVDVEFLYYWYQLIGEYIGIKYTQGTKQQSLNNDLVSKLKLAIPSLIEQEKIASFFSLIDKKIELQTEKVEELKNYKKGIMQKIFSQELRFKDENGNEYPEWEEVNLRKILKEVSEKTTVINQYEVISSTNNGLYLQKDYFNREIASKDNIGYKILKRNQVVLSPQNLWMGNINLNSKYDIGMVSPSYKIFDIKSEFDSSYIGFILRTDRAFYEYKQASEQGASIVRRNLNMDLFYDISFKLPCKVEQYKISKFINKIDCKIEQEMEKLDSLNQYKKGLLQQMFI